MENLNIPYEKNPFSEGIDFVIELPLLNST